MHVAGSDKINSLFVLFFLDISQNSTRPPPPPPPLPPPPLLYNL